jgi:hypothetical protein
MNGALNIHPKVVGATVGGTLGVLVVWLLGLAHVTVDPIVASALATSIAAAAGWLAPIVKAEAAKIEAPMPPKP